MTETNREADSVSESLRAAELEKINLEIRLLKTTGGVHARIVNYIPLITVFVAVGGLLFGILRFTNEQLKDRTAREGDRVVKVQEQIRTDVEQLLRFTTDERKTVATSMFLLDDLEKLLEFPVGNQKISGIYPEQRREITKGLERLVEDDCNLVEERDAAFALALFDRWKDYGDYLKEDYSEAGLPKVRFILFKYIRAFKTLRNKDPEFFKKFDYNPGSKTYIPVGDEWEVDEAAFVHYVDLEGGFRRHLKVLGPDAQAREEFIRAFQGAVCSSTLTQNIFAVSYPDIKDCSEQAATRNP